MIKFLTFFICSEEVPKGTECYEAFKTMQDCFSKYPAVYNKSGGDDEADDLDSVLGASSSESNSNIDSADQLDIAGSSAISTVASEVPETNQVAAAH